MRMKTLFIEHTPDNIDKEVELYGWVDSKRDHKRIIFIDLRDRSGIVQVVGDKRFKELSSEDVIWIKGMVNKRPANLINPKLKTGAIEVAATDLKILGKAAALPLPVSGDGYNVDEEVRQKYRYLDLRRPRLINNIILKSRFVQLIREFLFSNEFIEIETPILSKTTPEGARDFLVPSRLQKGKFYALPQSPQQYKQLLMVAGFERYFQIARCFRDEDPRADRAYGEFSQIDLEMSFVTREDVMNLTEKMITTTFEKLGAKLQKKPFPVFTYKEAMEKFGADKFDLRSEREKKENIQAFAWVIDFPFFEKTTLPQSSEGHADQGRWTFTHNPFSAPLPEHEKDLLNKTNIEHILTSQYDLVCNGYEVGGGSIRSHTPEMLRSVFEIMGYEKERIDEEFGHMLEAFSYGAPPHGGIAPGIDRLITCLTGEINLREVIAFPITSGGRTAVMDAPSDARDEQLQELDISVTGKNKDMNVFESIILLLKENKKEYKLFEHEPVITSQQAAEIRGTDLKKGAKALIMYADKKPIMIVVPADRKVDMKKFKTGFKIKDLRMATPEEVKTVSHVEIGAVPPFGNLFFIPLYVDNALFQNETIDFNAGSRTKSIEMKSVDFRTISKPILGNFT